MTARQQRISEARDAVRRSAARYVALKSADEPTEAEDLQALADIYAAMHGDTARRTAARRRQIA